MGERDFQFWRWGKIEKSASNSAPIVPDRRRSQRVKIVIPVLVYGRQGTEPFHEQTQTISVNAHGGLIQLATQVSRAQKLILTNPTTMQELACKVIRVGQMQDGKTPVGIEFVEPAPRFWHINFPPENWDPSERKRPEARAPIDSDSN